MKTVFTHLWHYLVKVLAGIIIFLLTAGWFAGLGAVIGVVILWMIHDLLWGPDYDYHEPVGTYEDIRWNCYIPAEDEENAWCFRTGYR